MLGTSVLTPTLRYHPSVVAQSFGTLGCLAPGRVFLGVGTGEALNETPATGQEFPGRKERRLRLAEAHQADPAPVDRGARGLRGRVLPHLEGDRSTTAPRSRCRSTWPRRGRSPRSWPDAWATASSARAARTRPSTTSCSARSPRAPRRPGATLGAIRRMIEVKVSYDRDRAAGARQLPLVGCAGAHSRAEGGRGGPDRDGAPRRRERRPGAAPASSPRTTPRRSPTGSAATSTSASTS